MSPVRQTIATEPERRGHQGEMDRVARRMREKAAGRLLPWTAYRPHFVCDLIRRVAAAYATTPRMILIAKSQQRNVCAARVEIIHQLRADKREFSLPTIGKWLGVHHTTVLVSLRRAAELRALPPPVPYDPNAIDESGVWAI